MKNTIIILAVIVVLGGSWYFWSKERFNKTALLNDTVSQVQNTTTDESVNNQLVQNPQNNSTDQQNNNQAVAQVKDYSVLCKGDATCKKYYIIWKDEQMLRNNYNEAYFNEHVVPNSMNINSWNDGESFYIIYDVVVGWAQVRTYDTFLIKTKAGNTTYPALKIARGAYLSQNDVRSVINSQAFNTHFTSFNPVYNLIFKSKIEALDTIYDKAGSRAFDANQNLEFKFSNKNISVTAVDSTNCAKNNTNKKITLDLVTGSSNVSGDACFIY